MELFHAKRSQLMGLVLVLAVTVESSGRNAKNDTLGFINMGPAGETEGKITVQCYTDNLGHMNEASMRLHLKTLVHKTITWDNQPGILAFGFQEGRISLDYENRLGWEHKKTNSESCEFIQTTLEGCLSGYTRAYTQRIKGTFSKGIYLYIFIRTAEVELLNFSIFTRANRIRTSTARFGKAGWAPLCRRISANKGCTAVTGTFRSKSNQDNTKRITFLCCHNSSDNLARNTVDFQKCAELANKYSSHVTFMMGDFNPRTKIFRPSGEPPADEWIKMSVEESKKGSRASVTVFSPKGEITLVEKGQEVTVVKDLENAALVRVRVGAGKEFDVPKGSLEPVETWSLECIETINKIIVDVAKNKTIVFHGTADEIAQVDHTRREMTLAWQTMENGKLFYPTDQLDTLYQLKGGESLEWREHRIAFKPTYVFNVNLGTQSARKRASNNNYDWSKDRTFQWTDRVLYKHEPGVQMTCDEYTSLHRVKDLDQSDHNPVYARFTIDF